MRVRAAPQMTEYSTPQLSVSGVLINRWRSTASAAELADEITTSMATHFPGVPVWLDRKVPQWQGIPDHLLAGRGLDEARQARLRLLAEDTYRPIAGELLGVGVAA